MNDDEKKGKFGKKVITCIVCGILFGLFAALSFYAVREVGEKAGFVDTDSNATIVANESDEKDEADEKTESASEPKEDNKSSVETKENDSFENNNELRMVAGGYYSVTDVVERTMPSIVSVLNNYTSNFYYFSQDSTASGSGIIIGANDDELLIVTNYHVIEGNNTITVIFCDDADCEAMVKGTDADMDLAVIAVPLDSIDKDTLGAIEYASLGDSDALKVGEPVIAIGNALGYGQSVTTGVVSALNRDINSSTKEAPKTEKNSGASGSPKVGETFIQTDAAINPGNSGGALLNMSGEVIGINSNKIGGGLVEGMGYAIPISSAKPIIEELMTKQTKKEVPDEQRAYFGISGATITEAEAEYYGYPIGVYVANVYPGTAAEEAGIEEGDVIVKFDDEKITSMEELQNLLICYSGGTTVKVELKRYNGEAYVEKTINVRLGYKSDIDRS